MPTLSLLNYSTTDECHPLCNPHVAGGGSKTYGEWEPVTRRRQHCFCWRQETSQMRACDVQMRSRPFLLSTLLCQPWQLPQATAESQPLAENCWPRRSHLLLWYFLTGYTEADLLVYPSPVKIHASQAGVTTAKRLCPCRGSAQLQGAAEGLEALPPTTIVCLQLDYAHGCFQCPQKVEECRENSSDNCLFVLKRGKKETLSVESINSWPSTCLWD